MVKPTCNFIMSNLSFLYFLESGMMMEKSLDMVQANHIDHTIPTARHVEPEVHHPQGQEVLLRSETENDREALLSTVIDTSRTETVL